MNAAPARLNLVRLNLTRLVLTRPDLGRLLPGLLAGLAIAAMARPLAQVLHAPAPLLAVVLGMAVGALGLGTRLAAGLDVWAKPGLRLGVAMMGAQITWSEFALLGGPAILASGAVVLGGLAMGAAVGMAVGLPLAEALIAAAACSICGASAALAASQAAPASPANQRTTALVIIGVNLLSTVAMLAYPPLAHAVGLTAHQAGVFFGLSIHDVAQVAGAGASVSPEAAGAAALAKLSRIVWLGPAVVLIGVLLTRSQDGGARTGLKAPPLFVMGFAALAALRGFGLLPPPLVATLATASSFLLLAGVGAISAKLGPAALMQVKPRLAAALALTTLAVAALAYSLTRLFF
ncbi:MULTISPECIES: putative sulfate exporter family transporter [unclassified Caulobacter]|uniref:putative sulfate exporter family transporter n=1 Tax=unclassified Caulobacter TaxID=2648921 RepID=UPI000D3946BC|nr:MULTISPECIES: putative sulfate exporter family transporter [unclassified Caulobacter]PTS83908.1 putative sulfate exporter family transporter [Caulobacter sp. HMWF009]PTT04777.1 putative sulfate exporter family transporter [Caulobacter sp. HMWF025]